MTISTNRREHIHILLVDDERSLLGPLTEYLSNYFAVTPAENGTVALNLVTEHHGGFDVALIDASLTPGPNGIEVMKEIRARCPNTEVIIFTGWGADQRQAALRGGAYRFVEKPFDRDELVILIRSAAQQVRLRSISQKMLASHGLGNIQQVVIDAASSLVFADDAAMVVVDPFNGRLKIRKSPHAQQTEHYFGKHLDGKSLTQEILKKGEIHSIPDIDAEKRVDPDLLKTEYKAFIGLPIPGEKGNQGVLYVYSHHAHHFDELGHTALLRTIVAQAGLALTNACAEEEIELHSQNAEALVRVSRELSASSTLEDLYNRAWQFVRERMGIKVFFIAIYDSTQDELSFPFYYHEGKTGPVENRKLDQRANWGPTGLVIKTEGEVFYNTHAEGAVYCRENGTSIFINGRPGECCFYYPIHIDGKVAGVISVQSEDAYGLQPIYLDTLRALGNHLAVTIKNIRLRETEQRQHDEAKALHQATLAVTTTIEIPLVIKRVLNSLQSVVPFDYASVQLLKCENEIVYFELIDGQGFPNLGQILNSRYAVDQRDTYWEVYQKQQTRIVSDIQCFQDDSPPLSHSPQDIRSWMGVPLIVNQKVIGLITLDSLVPGFYNKHHAQLAETFAVSVAQSIDNAAHHQETEHANKKLQAMTEALSLLRSEMEANKLLYETVHQAVELLGFKIGALYYYNDQLKEIEIIASYHLPEDLIGLRLPAAQCLAGKVAEAGVLSILNKNYHSQYPDDHILADYGLETTVVVPIKHPNQPEMKRVMLLADDIHHEVSKTDKDILMMLSDQAAIAIRTSQLMDSEERRTEHLTILQKVNELIQSRRKLDDILHVILTGMTAGYGLGFNRAVLLLVDRAKNGLRGRVAIGYLNAENARTDWVNSHKQRLDDFRTYLKALDEGRVPITPLGEMIPGMLFPVTQTYKERYLEGLTQGKCFRLRPKDLEQIPEFLQAFQPTSSMEIIPLMSNGEVLGLIIVDNKFNQVPITLRDDSSLLAFANTATVAIENERLLTKLEKTRAAALNINKVAVLGNLPQTLASIREAALLVLECEMFTLYIYDKETDRFIGREHFGCLDERHIRLPQDLKPHSSVHKVIALQDKPYYRTENSQQSPFFEGSFAKDEQIQATLAIKLTYKGDPVGALLINYRQPHHFSQDEIDNALLFADQAATAIQNARLYDRSVEQATYLQSLYEAGKVMTSSLSLPDTLQGLAEQARTLTGAGEGKSRFSKVLLVKEGKLRFEASAPQEFIGQAVDPDGSPCGITSRAYKTGKAQLIEDVGTDPDYICFNEDTLSEVVVPIKTNDRVIGVINVESPTRAAFDTQDQRNLELLASQAAIAIENAQAYADLRIAKGIIGTRTALAFMGMSSSMWHHTIEKDALTISEQVDLFKMNLDEPGFDYAEKNKLFERLDMIQQLAKQIMEKPMTPPLSSEENVEAVQLTQLLKQRASQLVERYNAPDYFQPPRLELDKEIKVWASSEWLKRALDILVDNAVKAVRACPIKQILIGARLTPDGRAQIYVRDSGAGIPENQRNKIGDEYIDKNPNEPGMGMGLVMVNLIANTYHGELGVGYTGEEGTEMTITLPIYPLS